MRVPARDLRRPPPVRRRSTCRWPHQPTLRRPSWPRPDHERGVSHHEPPGRAPTRACRRAGLLDGDAGQLGPVGGVRPVGPEDEEPVEIGRDEFGPGRSLHGSGHQAQQYSRLPQRRPGSPRPPATSGSARTPGCRPPGYRRYWAYSWSSSSSSGSRPITPCEGRFGPPGGRSPRPSVLPDVGGYPVELLEGGLQLRAPAPPVWTRVSSTSKSTATGLAVPLAMDLAQDSDIGGDPVGNAQDSAENMAVIWARSK